MVVPGKQPDHGTTPSRGHTDSSQIPSLLDNSLAWDVYVATWTGFVYVAFVIDAYSRRIVGWRAARSMTTDLVLDAVEHAFFTRAQDGTTSLRGLIAHTDAGSQYTSVAFTQRLIDEGVDPSVGSVGDALDNALAETTVGSFKNELIRRQGPWRDVNQVELATAEWVRVVQHRTPARVPRRLHPRGRREAPLRSQTHPTKGRVIQQKQSPDSPGRVIPTEPGELEACGQLAQICDRDRSGRLACA